MIPLPLCPRCKHFLGLDDKLKTQICKAFPKGIPLEIATNEFDHNKPYEGDNGIQFERGNPMNKIRKKMKK